MDMDKEQFKNHGLATSSAKIKNLVNTLLDKVEENGIAYFVSVRNGAKVEEFTLKSKGDSKVIATIELKPKYGIDIELHIKCTKDSDIDENVLALIKKSHLR